MLFLNKTDLFEKKIKTSPLSTCFSEYTGENNYGMACQYIKNKFESQNESKDLRNIFCHFTCATDTNLIRFTFSHVTDCIIQIKLKEFGLY